MKWDLNSRDPKINFVVLNLVLLIGLLVWGGAGVLLVLVFLFIGEQEIGGKWFCAMLPLAILSHWVPESAYVRTAVYVAGWVHANITLVKKRKSRDAGEVSQAGETHESAAIERQQ